MTMIKRICFSVLLLVASLRGFAQYNAVTEIWFEGSVQKKFDDLTITLAEGLRTHDGSMLQTFTELTGKYKVNKYLKFGLGYRYIQKPFLFSILEYDHRFSVDVGFSYKAGDFSFDFRPRYQHRVKGISGDDGSRSKTYNRNKFGVQYDINKDLSVQLGYEFFFRLAGDGRFVDQNRYAIETSYDISKKHRLNAFYMLQQEIQVDYPQLTHVMGLEYSFRL